jgi:histidine kinase
MHDAVVGSLDRALALALLAGVVAAAGMAVFVARLILRPIGRVRAATRRLAAGRYDQRVDPPVEAELAGLAADVNALARALDDTERRRVRLVSDVAHELRTPLTTIRGYTEGMLDGVIPRRRRGSDRGRRPCRAAGAARRRSRHAVASRRGPAGAAARSD